MWSLRRAVLVDPAISTREEPKGDQRRHGSPLRDLIDEEMEELLDFAGFLRRQRHRKPILPQMRISLW
jgi:hypothetical protein